MNTVRKVRYLFVCLQPRTFTAGTNGADGTACAKSTYTAGANVSEFYVMANGRMTPMFRLQGSSEGYLREIEAVRKAFNKGSENNSMITSANFFKENLCYFIDLSKSDSLLEENANSTHLDLHVRFATSGVATYAHCIFMNEQHLLLNAVDGTVRVRSIQN
jgi:hypothetical protein